MRLKKAVYINVADKDYVANLMPVKACYAEICYALAVLDTNPQRKYTVVQLIYCEILSCFFKFTSSTDDEIIYIEQLTISTKDFDDLYALYHRYFIWFSRITLASFTDDEYPVVMDAWGAVFNFFLRPLGSLLYHGNKRHIFFNIGIVAGKEYVFDLAAINDLQCRFLTMPGKASSYVVPVSGQSLAYMAERLNNVSSPTATKVILLNGFAELYDKEVIEHVPDDIRRIALKRPALFEKLFENARKSGVLVADLNTEKDLLKYFGKEWEGYIILIMAHYDNKGKKGRLQMKDRGIPFADFLGLIDKLREKGAMRNDIEIDAGTCTNFFDFRRLYPAGIKFISMSMHETDTDLAAYLLNELFSGVNAGITNWESPYLNGKCSLYEAKSNVLRCLYSMKPGTSII